MCTKTKITNYFTTELQYKTSLVMYCILTLLVLNILSICTVRSVAANPGDLDQSFGSYGKVTIDFDPSFGLSNFGLTIQPDGKLVAAGGKG